jgi:hypothetical protein
MSGGHKLATSRLSWLAIIPTCLAKIGILVPTRGDCGLGQEEALSMADRVGVMRQGSLEQIAAPDELYTDPPVLVAPRQVS